MDKKYLIIIIAVIAAIAIVGGYFLLNSQQDVDKTTLVLSDSAYMKVPLSDSATSKADKDGLFYYVDKEHGLNVTTYNSNVSKAAGLTKMNKLKNNLETGAKQSNEGNVVVYEKDGVYSIYIRNTKSNDTILLQSKDKNALLACWQSIKYHDPADTLKFEDTSSVVNVTQETQTAVAEASSSSSYSSSSSSDSSSDSDSSSSGSSESSYFSDSSSSSYSDSGESSYFSSGSGGGSGSGSGGSGGGGSGGGSSYF